jgi:uroporphyrin-III C-methyltransferase
LIGAGPGDPELLTIKAARVLRECDVVLYDRLVSPEIIELARPNAEVIYVGKHEGEQEHAQNRIFRLIRDHALAGKTVGRLKGGDPLVFGRGAEEWALASKHGIEVHFIPGVTSAIAVPGLAGIPLTYRRVSQSFAVVTGHCHEGSTHDWRRYAGIDTLVILMGVKNRASLAQALLDAGRAPDEPVAFIYRGSLPEEHVIQSTLLAVAEERVEVKNPAVFVIGKVVELRTLLGLTGVPELPRSEEPE